MIYRLLYKVLHDSAAVRDRVATRIYPRMAPNGVTGERIVLNVISGIAHNHVSNEVGVGERIVQVSCFADSAVAAESGFELVRLRLSGFKSDIEILDPAGTPREYTFQANLINANDLVSEPRDASDKGAYQHSGDFQVFYEQDVPTHV
jgi:hypothetical protein